MSHSRLADLQGSFVAQAEADAEAEAAAAAQAETVEHANENDNVDTSIQRLVCVCDIRTLLGPDERRYSKSDFQGHDTKVNNGTDEKYT